MYFPIWGKNHWQKYDLRISLRGSSANFKCSANAECTRCQKHPRVPNLTWCLDRQVDVLMHLENSQFLNTLMAWCPTDAKQRAHQSVLMLLTKYHASNTCQCIVFTNRTITNQIHFNYHRIGFEDRFAHFPDRILRKWLEIRHLRTRVHFCQWKGKLSSCSKPN